MPIIELPYHTDSTALFNPLRALPFACWLDSGKPNSHSGRYDIMTALPRRRWITHNNSTHPSKTECQHYDGIGQLHRQTYHTQDPLSLLKSAEQELSSDPSINHIPFSGGIIAYFAYEFGRDQLDISQRSPNTCSLPSMVAGEYLWAVIQDHELKQCYVVAHSDCESNVIDHVIQTIDSAAHYTAEPFAIDELRSNTTTSEYHQKIAAIHDYITAGDCYQVNFSQCFSSHYTGDPYTAYKQLRTTMASPFSAFIDIGEGQSILSLSPERFIETQGKQVLTQPIKGTIARHSDATIDNNHAQHLQESSKNRAENLMIVDLLRNDLGKSCTPGSIKVPALFSLESYPNVHHLVSSITGTLKKEKTALDLFQGCFPGGSITGAPKKRAMEIIEELENCQRSIYCGSIAYLNNNGNLDSNITIRTIGCDGKKLYCWGGGGIVADSEADDEYQESLTKINTILGVLNQFKN